MFDLNKLKRTLGFALLSAVAIGANAQIIQHERLLSFEDSKVPSYITGAKSSLKISDERFKDGEKSLKWTFKPNTSIVINKDIHFEPKDETGVDTYLSTFSMWVYNPKAIDGNLNFEFLKDGKKASYFSMDMKFTGWRAIYASFERDMEGTPIEGMNQIKITAPEEEGNVYLDLMITAAKADHRHHTPDKLLPNLNKGIANHWLIMLANSEIAPDPALFQAQVSDKDIADVAIMEDRLKELIFTPIKVNKNQVDKLKREFNIYNIQKKNDIITGTSMFFARWAESFERLIPNWEKNMYVKAGQEYQKYFNLTNKIAIAYNSTKDTQLQQELASMFLLMYDHATDQGIAYGSGLGNATHYGYSFRGLFTAYFLMKDVLLANNRLEEAMHTLQWYAQTNETFIRPIKDGIDMDSFNTLSMGRICSVLIMEDSTEKMQYVRAFSRWIDTGCKPAPGLDGAFKIDGGAFHHRNNYPAYAVGGLNGATNMLYLLSNTNYAVSKLGHETLKHVLLTMRFYCNKTYFPLAMSGRHPDGKGDIVPMHYARMAVAGTPTQSEKIDKEMAAAYLRLVSEGNTEEKPEYVPTSNRAEEKKMIDLFVGQGIVAENDPQGNIAIGYGCVSAQRRSNWSAVVRGHSRYLWAAEHYLGANLYGRYLAHGSMQIMTADKGANVTPETSGWLQPGFDWARIPGATALHLPVEKLKANVLNVDVFSGFEEMLYSDEAFAGGLTHHGNGSFGMKLHEHDKYNGSLRARKSYHFFDNKIVCLGTGIENKDADYNTETTIFQLSGAKQDFSNYWNNTSVNTNYIIDQLGTGYYIPNTDNVVFEKNFPQKSRFQNSGKESSGNWVNLVVNHGKAPSNGTYEYVVLPQTEIKINDSNKIASAYEVIQKDNNAHIVKDKTTNTTSYILFEAPQQLPSKIVEKVDNSCLMMVTERKAELDLTVANPDLALYSGESDELFDENGKRVERSIYSRPWIGNASQEVPVTVTLKGKWMLTENEGNVIMNVQKNKTTIVFKCKDGKSINLKLTQVK